MEAVGPIIIPFFVSFYVVVVVIVLKYAYAASSSILAT
jgi:hypothetical protein